MSNKEKELNSHEVINAEFNSLIQKIKSENDLLGDDRGNKDYDIAIISIKNHDDLDKVNRMIQITNDKYYNAHKLLPEKRIGKTIALSLGYGYEEEYQDIGYCYGTKEEILKDIENRLNKTFNIEKVENEGSKNQKDK